MASVRAGLAAINGFLDALVPHDDIVLGGVRVGDLRPA